MHASHSIRLGRSGRLHTYKTTTDRALRAHSYDFVSLTSGVPPGVELPRPRDHEIRPLVLPYGVAVGIGVAVAVAIGVAVVGVLAARERLVGRRGRQDLS